MNMKLKLLSLRKTPSTNPIMNSVLKDATAEQTNQVLQLMTEIATNPNICAFFTHEKENGVVFSAEVLYYLLELCPQMNIAIEILEQSMLPDPALESFGAYCDRMSANFNLNDVKCNVVWNGDHIAYRCKTCGLSDSSCMCVDCFHTEDHIGHDFRIYRCSSGGCCDCGDPLAWDKDAFCQKHKHSKERSDKLDKQMNDQLSHIEVKNIRTAFTSVIRLCTKVILLAHEECEQTGLAANPGKVFEDFSTEMQGYLNKLFVCLEWLNKVSSCCFQFRSIITELLLQPITSENPEIITSHDIIVKLQRSTAETSELTYSNCSVILDIMLQYGIFLPEKQADALGVFFLKLLFDTSFKSIYTDHFLKFYPLCLELYLTPSLTEQGLKSISRFLDRIFCQLFHSSIQVLPLVVDSSNNSVLLMVLTKLVVLFQSTLLDVSSPSISVVDCVHRVFRERIYSRLCMDIKSILVHEKAATLAVFNSFLSEEKEKFKFIEESTYGYFLLMLKTLQQMNLQQRQLIRHVEYESNAWTFSFVLDYELNGLTQHFIQGLHMYVCSFENQCKEDELYLIRSILNPCEKALFEWFDSIDFFCPNKEFYNVFTKPVSFHLPLHHFYGSLLYQMLHTSNAGDRICIQDVLNKKLAFSLIDHPIRILVLLSGITSGFWVRNGSIMSQQLTHHHSKYWRENGFCMDIFLLQNCLLIAGGRDFIIFYINSFLSYLNPLVFELDDVTKKGVAVDEMEFVLVEEMLRYLLIIATNTSKLQRGCRESTDSLVREEIVNWLSLGQQLTASELNNRLSVKYTEGATDVLDKNLSLVSHFHTSLQEEEHHIKLEECNSNTNSYYSLQWEKYSEVNLLFMQLNRSDVQKIEENYKKNYRKIAQHLDQKEGFGSQLIPPFVAKKKNIVLNCFNCVASEILSCPLFHAIIFVVLYNSVFHRKKNTSNKKISEGMLNLALYSVVYAIELGQDLSSSKQHHEEYNGAFASSNILTFCQEIANQYSSWNVVENFEKKIFVDVIDGTSIVSLLIDMCYGGDFNDQNALLNLILKRLCSKSIHIEKLVNQAVIGKTMNANKRNGNSNDMIEKDSRMKLAKKRQEMILARMQQKQQSFQRRNKAISRTLRRVDVDDSDDNIEKDEDYDSDEEWGFPTGDNVSLFLQTLTKEQGELDSETCSLCKSNTRSLNGDEVGLVGLASWTSKGLRIASCHHYIHARCLNEYLEVLKQKKSNWQSYEGDRVVCLEAGEFLCPICRRLANFIFPVHIIAPSSRTNCTLQFHRWLFQRKQLQSNSTVNIKNSKKRSEGPGHRLCQKLFSIGYGHQLNKETMEIITQDVVLKHMKKHSQPIHYLNQAQLTLIQNLINIENFSDGVCNPSDHVYLKSLFHSILSLQHELKDEIQLENQTQDNILFARNMLLEEEEKPVLCNNLFSCILNGLFHSIWLKVNKEQQGGQLRITSDLIEWCSMEFYYLVRLTYPAYILQSIMLLLLDKPNKEAAVDIAFSQTSDWKHVKNLQDAVYYIELMLKRCHGINSSSDSISIADLVNRRDVYLRQVRLFMSCCLGFDLSIDSRSLTTQLRLDDNLDSLFGDLHEEHSKLLSLWLAQYEAHSALLKKSFSHLTGLVKKPLLKLIDLAPIYADFFLVYCHENSVCNLCQTVPKHPAVCLLCGALVCCHSLCCRFNGLGECTSHAISCEGAGLGVFLLVQACTVLVLTGHGRRCVWGSLYLDRNGEEDSYMKRGRTLYLNQARYDKLNVMINTNGFSQNTRILDKTSNRDGNRY